MPAMVRPSLPGYLTKLRLMPDERRRFTVTPHRAKIGYGVSAARLRELLDGGLPHSIEAGEPRLDPYDLINVSLDFGLPSAWSLTMRYWAAALSFPGVLRCCDVRYVFTCPDPGHAGPCDVRVLTPDQGEQRLALDRPNPGTTLELVSRYRLDNVRPAVPPAVRELMADMRGLEFKVLPWGMSADDDFVRRTRWVDCVGGARMLVAEAERRGLAVRLSMGLAVIQPSSVLHSWAEFLIDEIWVPMDPLMVNALIRWGRLDAAGWDPVPPTGGVLGRLSDSVVPPARHNGRYQHLPMPTTMVTGE